MPRRTTSGATVFWRISLIGIALGLLRLLCEPDNLSAAADPGKCGRTIRRG